jgi:hypothetical protein
MKKKLIGIAVASFGMILSVGSAIALYVPAADPASFGIGQGTYEGSEGAITYKINGNTSGTVAPQYLKGDGTNGGTGLGGEYTQVKYEFALSATYSSSLIAQNFVVGNISVGIEDIPAKYQGKLSIWAGIEGYADASLGEHYYASSLMPGGTDFAINDEEGHASFSASGDIAVAASGTQKLCVYLKYNLGDIKLTEQDEASLGYSLEVSWSGPKSFTYAYVKGDSIMWAADDKYAMNPNINKPYAEGWEWVYNNLPGSFGPGAKCQLGDDWSADPNAALDAEKTYDVYWTGSNEAAANFQEQA